MSRAGYEDGDYGTEWDQIRWRGAVASALNGRRGQAFLREMLAAFDALPKPELIADELEASGKPGDEVGQVCALGAVGKARGLDMAHVDAHDYHSVAGVFGIPESLAREIMWENDEAPVGVSHSKWRRFEWMRSWVIARLKTPIR